jgi:two-component system sensor histidine kinase RegB
MLPVVVAAATLPPIATWRVAGLAAVSYTVLLFVHRPFPPWGHHGHELSTHLLGMWVGFLLAAALVAAFVARIGQALALHERELSLARERALESERTLALGTLAAGTAHELGTPLATIATLARELERATAATAETHAQARLLREEVGRCKEILARMARDAGNQQAERGAARRLDEFLAATIEEWRRLRPGAPLVARLEGPRPAPQIVADRTLAQAIMNLLHNAADATPGAIELAARWDGGQLEVTVSDDGPGMPEALAAQAGRRVLSTRAGEGGMGLGLYLTRTTLERMGGQLRLQSHPGAGVQARMALPLQALLLPEPAGRREAAGMEAS